MRSLSELSCMVRPRRIRALVPCLALTALVSVHCSSSGSSDDDDDDDGGTSNGGESGEPATGGSSGRAGASPSGRSGRGGSGTTGGTGGDLGAGGAGRDGGSSGASEGGAGATTGDSGSAGTSSNHGNAGEATGGTSFGRGGSAGQGGGLGCGASRGFEILPEPGNTADTGWVSASTNCMGVSGPISVTHDAGSSITLDSADGRLCVSGHVDKGASAVADRSTGARLSIQLNNPDNAAMPSMYNALDEGVGGYRFTLTGASVPPEIRPTFHILGTETDYCRRICAAGLQSALFNVSDAYCWDGTGALQSGVGILALEFAIPANEAADVDFDFCIEGIFGITDNTSVGDPGSCG